MLYLWIKWTKQLIDCGSIQHVGWAKNEYFRQVIYNFIAYMLLLVWKTNDNQSKLPPTHPMVSWRRANMYFDGILRICPQKGSWDRKIAIPQLSSWLSLISSRVGFTVFYWVRKKHSIPFWLLKQNSVALFVHHYNGLFTGCTAVWWMGAGS